MKVCISTLSVVFVLCLLAAGVSGQQASNPPFDFPAHVDVPGDKSEEGRYRDMVRRNNERSRGQGPAPEPRAKEGSAGAGGKKIERPMPAFSNSRTPVTLAWKLLKKFNPTKIENVLYVNGTDKCPAR